MSRSTDKNGLWVSNDAPTYGVNQGGRLVIYARADTMADLDAALLSEGLREEVTQEPLREYGPEEVVHSEPLRYDEEGDEIVDWTGEYDGWRTNGDTLEYFVDGPLLSETPQDPIVRDMPHIEIVVFQHTTEQGAPAIYATVSGAVSIYGPFDELARVTDGEFVQYVERKRGAGQGWAVADGATVAEGDLLADAVAPVIDPRPHCNIKIDLRWRDADKSFATLQKWMSDGRGLEMGEQNRNEKGLVLGGITILKPGTFTPKLVFA